MEIAQHFGDTYSLDSTLIFFPWASWQPQRKWRHGHLHNFLSERTLCINSAGDKNLFLTLGYDAGSLLGGNTVPWGPLEISGNTSGCHNRERALLASRMWRPGVLPNTPLCKDGPAIKNYLAPKFNKPRLRIIKSTLSYKINFSCGRLPCSLWGPHSTWLWNRADFGWNPWFYHLPAV